MMEDEHIFEPLGFVLESLASKNGQIDLYGRAAISYGAAAVAPIEIDDAVFGLSPEAITQWRDAEQKLLRVIQLGQLVVRGFRAGDGGRPAEQVEKEVFACVKVAGPAESEEEIFNRQFDKENPFLVLGDYSDWPHCEGDVIQKDGAVLWSRLRIKRSEYLRLFPETKAPTKPKRVRGRPAKSGKPMTAAERMKTMRMAKKAKSAD